jgi:hypothetical protein
MPSPATSIYISLFGAGPQAWPHFANAVKYLIGISVVVMSATHPTWSKGSDEWDLARVVWLFLMILSTVYSYFWGMYSPIRRPHAGKSGDILWCILNKKLTWQMPPTFSPVWYSELGDVNTPPLPFPRLGERGAC